MKKIFKNNIQFVVAAAQRNAVKEILPTLFKILVWMKLNLFQIRKKQVKLKLFSITNGIQVFKRLDTLLLF